MRTAAAILRLGGAAASATKKISCSSSLFMRRSSSSAEKKGVESEKSLYLCFGEKCFYSMNQVVRPVRLKNIDNDDGGEYLTEAVYKTSEDIGEWRFPGRFGSQILFPSGRTHINRVDMTSRSMEFENFTTEFSSPKMNPLLVELDGKLYCIDKDNRHRPLEVLDPEDDFKWRPVDNPPFSIKGREEKRLCTLGSNKFLAWEQGKAGVYCFDVTKPENGWKETAFSLGNALPFLATRSCDECGEYSSEGECSFHQVTKHLPKASPKPPIFIHDHNREFGDFYVMFTYDYSDALSPFFMLHNCNSFQPIRKKIHLPVEFCSKYLQPFDTHLDYEFVHLGGQKVCLVLSKYFDDENTGILLLITFQYAVGNNSKLSKLDIIPKLDIMPTILWTRHFRYHPINEETLDLKLTGAFVL